MTELSPAAKAVLKAITEISPAPADEIAAAALRAVAMEVVLDKYQYADWRMADVIMNKIQAIADELESAQ